MAGIDEGRVADGNGGITFSLDVCQTQGQRRLHPLEHQLERLFLDSCGAPPKLGQRLDNRFQRDVAAFERAGHVDRRIGVGEADEGLPSAGVVRGERDVASRVERAILVDHRRIQQAFDLYRNIRRR